MGLNIALQAKQQENSYVRSRLSFDPRPHCQHLELTFTTFCRSSNRPNNVYIYIKLKRDRHVREAGLTSSSSLATSTRTITSNRASLCLGSRSRTHTTDQGTMASTYEDQSGQTLRRAVDSRDRSSRKPVPENRASLSSITNHHSRRPADISSMPSSESLSLASSDRTLRNPPFPKLLSSESASTSTEQQLLSSQRNQFVADDGLVPSFHHHDSLSHHSKSAHHGPKTPSFIFAKHTHHHLTNHPSSNSNHNSTQH
jgi:hypothetical protein